jgi:hypothetical protein
VVVLVAGAGGDDDFDDAVANHDGDLRAGVELEFGAIGEGDQHGRVAAGDLIAGKDGPGRDAVGERGAVDAERPGAGNACDGRICGSVGVGRLGAGFGAYQERNCEKTSEYSIHVVCLRH